MVSQPEAVRVVGMAEVETSSPFFLAFSQQLLSCRYFEYMVYHVMYLLTYLSTSYLGADSTYLPTMADDRVYLPMTYLYQYT